jgi:myo-inositol-1(or 4)-monophosphatase
MTSPDDDVLDQSELRAAAAVARAAAERAIEITRELPVGQVDTKRHQADLVTAVDTAVERAVRDIIAAELPDHAIVGEEYGGEPGDGPTWYCDPVDGTTNLTAGLPWTSFSLALAVGDRPQVGVVTDPWRGEVAEAVTGGGVTVNGQPRPRPTTDTIAPGSLAGTVVGTEWASYRPWPGMETLLTELAGRHCTTRLMGSSTMTLAQVGLGRTVGAVIGTFQPIDHLAATLLCQEAGMVVRNEAGESCTFPSTGGVLVARPDIADELYAIWAAAIR